MNTELKNSLHLLREAIEAGSVLLPVSPKNWTSPRYVRLVEVRKPSTEARYSQHINLCRISALGNQTSPDLDAEIAAAVDAGFAWAVAVDWRSVDVELEGEFVRVSLEDAKGEEIHVVAPTAHKFTQWALSEQQSEKKAPHE